MKKTFILLLCILLLLCTCSCVIDTSLDTSSSDSSDDLFTDSFLSDDSNDISGEQSSELSNDSSDDISGDASDDIPSDDESSADLNIYNIHTAAISADAEVRQYYDPDLGDYVTAYYVCAQHFNYTVVTDNDGNAVVDFPLEVVQKENGFGFTFVGRGFDKKYYGFAVKNTAGGLEVNYTEIPTETISIDLGYGRIAKIVVLPNQLAGQSKTKWNDPFEKYQNASYYDAGFCVSDSLFGTAQMWNCPVSLPELNEEQQIIFDRLSEERAALREKYCRPTYLPDFENDPEAFEYFQLPDEYYYVQCYKEMGFTLEDFYQADDRADLILQGYNYLKQKHGDDMFLSQIDSPYLGHCDTSQRYRTIDILYEGDHDKIRRELCDISACYYDGKVYNNSWFDDYNEPLEDLAKDGFLVPIMDFVSMIEFQKTVKEHPMYDDPYAGITFFPEAMRCYKKYA